MPRKLSKKDLQERARAKKLSASGTCEELRQRLGLKQVKRGAACSRRSDAKRTLPNALVAWNMACKEAGYMQKGVNVRDQKLPARGTAANAALLKRRDEILASM